MPYKFLPLLLIIQLTLFIPVYSQTSEQLRANLYSYNTDGTLALNDGNLTMYNENNTNAIDGMDAIKMTNFAENFGLLRGSTTLAIERRQTIILADTIFFKMWNMRQKNYKVTFFIAGMSHPGLTGVLADKYLQTTTPVNLSGATSVLFTITKDAASAATDRFSIIFSSPLFKLLPITFTSLKAYRYKLPDMQAGNNVVEWTVENDKEIVQYQVERSGNGQQFSKVSSICLAHRSQLKYQWIDSSSPEEITFYRIKSVDVNGSVQYSGITKILGNSGVGSVSVYPNPATNGNITINLGDQPKGIYLARLINQYGQVVYAGKIQHTGGSMPQSLPLKRNTGKGNYVLEISTPQNSIIQRKIVIE